MEASPSDLVIRSWSNLLPLKLQLAADNVTSPVRPQPLHVLVPRQGYLSTVANQAWPHFQHVLPHLPGQQGLRPWFDYQQLPLRGNLPVGVLFDLLSSHDASGAPSLPWELTIHYTGMPESLVSWHNGLPTHSQYFHSLKEACFICRGPDGSGAVMKMTSAAQDAMWASIERSEASRYRAALASLRVTPSERQGAPPAVPTRLLLRAASGGFGGGAAAGGGAASWDDTFVTSRPVTAVNADGSWTTLGQVLEGMLPGLSFVAPAGPPAAAVEVAEAGGGGGVEHRAIGTAAAGSAAAAASSQGGDVAKGIEAAPVRPPGVRGSGDSGGVGGLQPPSDEGTAAGQAEESVPAGDLPEASSGSAASATAAVSDSSDVAEGTGPSKPEPEAAAAGAAAAEAEQVPPAGPAQGPGQASVMLGMSASVFGALPKPSRALDAAAGCSCEAVVCGVVPPLETPMAWLHAHLHAPDFFLYVVVRRAASEGAGT